MDEILIGWKEIAKYLRVSEKTAMRYEKEKMLPVKRDPAGHPTIRKSRADHWRLIAQTT